MTRREFHFEDGKSAKFWAIELTGSEHTVQFGRIGTNGQTKTKAFDSEAEASASAKKLIASKVKKGYVEQGADDTAPAPATETEPKTKPKPKPKPKPKAKAKPKAPATAAPSPDGLPNLGLSDWAWRLAPWRQLPPLERGTPRPFKRDKALERLRKLQGAFQRSYGGFNWEKELAPALTREEAAFWLRVAIKLDYQHPPETVADAIADDDDDLAVVEAEFEVAWPASIAAEAALRLLPHLWSDGRVVDLVTKLFRDREVWSRPGQSPDGAGLSVLDAFGAALLPYLPQEERDRLAELAVAALGESVWPELTVTGPRAWYLAAMLGRVEPVRALVRSWADDRFSDTLAHYQHPVRLLLGLGDANEIRSEARRLGLHPGDVFELRGWLAGTGPAGLTWAAAGLLGEASYMAEDQLKVLFAGDEPELADAALTLATGSKTLTKAADKWNSKHPVTAARGLLRVVAAGEKKRTEAAWARLRDLVAIDGGDALRAALELEPVSSELRARIDADLLGEDSGEALGSDDLPASIRAALVDVTALGKPPKAANPDWLSPRSVPGPTIGGAPLGPEAMAGVLRAVFESTVNGTASGPGVALLRRLKQEADPESLDAFAWDLYELWERRGTPSQQKWVMHALGHLGGPETVARLTPLVRAWPGQSQHARAVLGLECLRTIGTDLALSAIAGIAAKLKYRALKQRAGDLMQDIASDRGLSTEALADRLVPDCGLDADGQRTFDYGGRTFRFCLGPELNPMVQNEAGKLLKAPPKPGKKDDPEQAPAALKEWRAFRKLVKGTLALQVERLERAMVSGRRWSLEEFETFLVGHPLLRSVIIMMVWADHGAEPAATFRVTETGARLDVAGKPLEVKGPVGLLHPLALEAEARARWQQVLDDEELLAPFPQLEREVFEATDAERTARALERGAGLPIGQTALRGLLAKLGWTRGEPQDAGVVHEHIKVFEAAGVTAVLQHGGISVDGYEFADASPVERVLFLPGQLPIEECVWTPPEQGLAINAVDPVVLSEVLRDLQVLAAKAQS